MNSKEKNNVSYLVPFVLAMALVPLICIIHSYDCGLQDEEWIYINGNVSDFFLYYKSVLVTVAGVMMLVLLGWQISKMRRKETLASADTRIFIPILIYIILVIYIYGVFLLRRT